VRRTFPCLLFVVLACSRSGGQQATPLPADEGPMTVVPRTESVSMGAPGGPFRPDRHAFSLRNDGEAALRWSVEVSEDWLRADGPGAGVLPPRASVPVHVRLDPVRSAALPAGTHTATLQFRAGDDGHAVTSRKVVLEAVAPEGGWTEFTPSPDARTVYVSSTTGDDANDGLGEARAKRSLAAAKALLRHGFPDRLLLRRGDTWQESLGHWKTSGRSRSEPMLVSTFGDADARPLLQTGTRGGLWTNGGGGSPPTVDHVAVVGLRFVADGYDGHDGEAGVLLLLPGSDILIEDCAFERYAANVVFQGFDGRLSDVRLRRCVILDAWAIDGRAQGLYVDAVDGLLVEENVFDHNGWREDLPGAGADIYSHDIYVDNGNTGVTVLGNVIANAASHGLQLRCGGLAADNLFVRNSIGLLVGGGNAPEPGGVTADVHDNVVLDGKDIDPAHPRGWGITLENIASGRVRGNVVAHGVSGGMPHALELAGNGPFGIRDLRIEENILYDWSGSLTIHGDASSLSGIVLARNDIQEPRGRRALITIGDDGAVASIRSDGNRLFHRLLPGRAWVRLDGEDCSLASWQQRVHDLSSNSGAVDYPDPGRDLATYAGMLGEQGGAASVLAAMRAQSRAAWRPEFTASAVNRYVRAGFGLPSP
jgi:hypothetical protein